MFGFLKLLADDDDEERSDETPPVQGRSMVDPVAWDGFWREELESGMAAFVDMFCASGGLVDAMRANGLRTILCAGSGISQEPRALAHAGFDVTALDLSPLAMRIASETKPPRKWLDKLIERRTPRRGGKIRFVTGDIRDPSICPGPYDVIIDRRMLQLFSEEDRRAAMRALAGRLRSPGLFFSHSHRNGPARRGCPADWFNAEGWPRWRGGAHLTGQVAWLFSSSG